jgi:hypothetical protein
MSSDAPRQSLLEELDARQDQLLDDLDRLNGQIEAALRDILAWRQNLDLASAPAVA